MSCPGPTELGLTHYPRRPHASRQLPKDDMPPYWVEKGYCNDGPRQKRAPQNPSPARTQAAGQQARPGWVQASAHPVVLGYTLTACAKVQYWDRDTPLCGFTSGRVSGSQLHRHVLSPRIQERGTGSGSPMQQTQVILGTTHNSQCPWSWTGWH